VKKSLVILSLSIVFLYLFYSVALALSVKVLVEGIEGDLLKNVLAFLSIEGEKDSPDLSEDDLQRLHTKAHNEISRSLQPFGFYRPQIQSELIQDDSGWTARYRIDPGEPIRVSEVDLHIEGPGIDDPELRKLVEAFPIREGDILEHKVYENEKQRFQVVSNERGYFDMEMKRHEIRVDIQAYRASIILHLDTGPRYHFGPVSFKQEGLDPAFLERFVPFRRGEPYTITDLLKLEDNLVNSDYFDRVEVEILRDKAEGLALPIEVRLLLHKRQKYSFGIGFGTDTGVRGSVGFELRRLNTKGHRFKTDLKISEIKTDLTARYLIPMKNPQTDQLLLTTGWVDEYTDALDSETLLFGATLSFLRFGLQNSFSLSYLRERFTAGSQSSTSTLLMPEAAFSLIKADDPLYTTRGHRLIVKIRGAEKSMGSDSSFVQGRIEGKLVRRVGMNGRFIVRGDIGYSVVSAITDLPGSIRFYAGGDQSVRGYGYKTLGPTDETGDVIGGKHLMVGSIEYEHKIKGNWSVAAFYDTGNALNSFSDSLKQGAGLGVRWKSPIGLVRLDIASALSKPGNPLRLHVNIGADI
jgi:translocation and assembly module TamA